MALKEAASGAFAPWRMKFSSAFQSMTWNSSSTPTSANCCWMNSFMILGPHLARPEVEIATFILSFFCGP